MAFDLTAVVPAYNGSRFIQQTLKSLVGQQDVRLELIVVDDGSSDGTAEIAESTPGVSRVVRQQNAGVAVARNRGLSLASAAHVAFVDQDDLWHPGRARLMLDHLNRKGGAAVGTTETPFALESDRAALRAVGDGRDGWPTRWLSDGSEVDVLCSGQLEELGGSGQVAEITLDRFMAAPAALTTSFIYEREAAIASGGCAPWIKAADDHVLNICIARTQGPIARIDVPCLFYRVHPASTTTTSPLVAAYLTMSLAMRYGRALPSSAVDSDYVRHLYSLMPSTDLSVVEQAALVVLTSPEEARRKNLRKLVRRHAAKRLRAWSSRGREINDHEVGAARSR